jgi:hypothetical protein
VHRGTYRLCSHIACLLLSTELNSPLQRIRIEYKRLTIVLIKPSKYDDEGYGIRHFRGVLPGNTVACLCSLTENLNRRDTLGDYLEI